MSIISNLIEAAESKFEEWFEETKLQRGADDLFYHFCYNLDKEELEEELHQKAKDENIDPEKLQIFIDEQTELVLKEHARSWFEERISNFEYDLNNSLEIIDDKFIKIFRSISINKCDYEIFLKKLSNNEFLYGNNGIGVYWAFKKEAVDCHWQMDSKYKKDEGIVLIFEGIIPIESINIDMTAILNLHISCGEDEKEIRLNENDYIHLTKINDESVDFLVKI